MATLQKIRDRAGLLIAIVIGLALLAFILGDILSTNSSLFRGNQFEVGKVKRKSIQYNDYIRQVEELTNVMKINSGRSSLDQSTLDYVRNQTWDQIVEDILYADEFKNLGIGVSTEELSDMIQGENPHYLVRQMFTNPQTGELNKSSIINFWKSLNEDETGERILVANYIENTIIRQRKIQKYTNLLRKGLYVTKLEAKDELAKANTKAGIRYIPQRYSDVVDSLVTITDKDLKDYFNKNRKKYKQQESRDIAFVSFDIIPSEEDNKIVLNKVIGLKEEFKKLENNEQFIKRHSDEKFTESYYTRGELPELLMDSLFNEDIGFVFGPYFEGESVKLAKMVNKQLVPDSMKARHILIQPNQTRTKEEAEALADSLYNVVKKGADFATLATEYSDDPGSREKGGDLDWFADGQMVKSFNDACLEGNVGDIVMVESAYGYHIIEILGQNAKEYKVKVAFVVQNVIPGKQTVQEQYSKAVEFAADCKSEEIFEKKILDKNLERLIANNVTKNDKNIQGIDNSRSIVQWAYKSKVGDVSDIFELDRSFVVAVLTKAKENGLAEFEDVKSEIEFEVKREKKADYIIGKIGDKVKAANNISELAIDIPAVVKDAENVTFSTYAISGLGSEPKINAAALYYPKEKVSEPIVGNSGVYVIYVKDRAEADIENFALNNVKMRLTRDLQSRSNYKPLEVLKEEANIEDNRVRFY